MSDDGMSWSRKIGPEHAAALRKVSEAGLRTAESMRRLGDAIRDLDDQDDDDE